MSRPEYHKVLAVDALRFAGIWYGVALFDVVDADGAAHFTGKRQECERYIEIRRSKDQAVAEGRSPHRAWPMRKYRRRLRVAP